MLFSSLMMNPNNLRCVITSCDVVKKSSFFHDSKYMLSKWYTRWMPFSHNRSMAYPINFENIRGATFKPKVREQC